MHCYFCPHILWVYYFCRSQCDTAKIPSEIKLALTDQIHLIGWKIMKILDSEFWNWLLDLMSKILLLKNYQKTSVRFYRFHSLLTTNWVLMMNLHLTSGTFFVLNINQVTLKTKIENLINDQIFKKLNLKNHLGRLHSHILHE